VRSERAFSGSADSNLRKPAFRLSRAGARTAKKKKTSEPDLAVESSAAHDQDDAELAAIVGRQIGCSAPNWLEWFLSESLRAERPNWLPRAQLKPAAAIARQAPNIMRLGLREKIKPPGAGTSAVRPPDPSPGNRWALVGCWRTAHPGGHQARLLALENSPGYWFARVRKRSTSR